MSATTADAIADCVVAVDLVGSGPDRLSPLQPRTTALVERPPLRPTSSLRDKWGQLAVATRRTTLSNLWYGMTQPRKLRPLMLSPTGVFRRVWDLVLAAGVIYLCWYIPFNVALVWWTPSEELGSFNEFLDFVFAADIVLSFRTAIVLYGEVVDDPKVVAEKYIKSWFLIDLVAVFPAEWLLSVNKSSTKSVKLLKYIKLPRLLRLSQLVRRFRRFQRYEGSLTIFSAFIFSVHIFGCGWILALQPCANLAADSPNDLHAFCDPKNAFEAYSLGFHYALSIMACMSFDCVYSTLDPLCGGYHLKYLNATAIPQGLLVMSNMMAIVGLLLGSIIIGSSVFVVESWNRAGYQFRKRIDVINHEMDFLQLPGHLRHRIQMYHQYLWTHQGSATEKISLLQDKGMSEPLRKEIAIFMYRDMLVKIPLFRTASDQLLGMICMCLTTVIYLPKDIIITRGELGKDLFVIAKGTVIVLAEPLMQTLLIQVDGAEDNIVLGEGSFFGEIGLLMEVERTRTVVADTICELGVLTKGDFDRVMYQFPAFADEIQKLMVARKACNNQETTSMSASEATAFSNALRHGSLVAPDVALPATSVHGYSRRTVVPPPPPPTSIEARLERIEMMLKRLMPNKE
ncbi:Voltage-gated Ion Channel (VIC) Superfamily [Achlya hypogyna]|uniref:Voltage-gated Ion Channel (VIC) Superfamily n=1 Tax=Achlya hypogyna TaxID=1202772 RepID=A0A1V9ZEU5_ACHHY|nr:Voltage-gated Ion Channel (VIC) Superfamily [Achlya hypogyna]